MEPITAELADHLLTHPGARPPGTTFKFTVTWATVSLDGAKHRMPQFDVIADNGHPAGSEPMRFVAVVGEPAVALNVNSTLIAFGEHADAGIRFMADNDDIQQVLVTIGEGIDANTNPDDYPMESYTFNEEPLEPPVIG